jgi:transcriptional regulator with XRE-family HTH domain
MTDDQNGELSGTQRFGQYMTEAVRAAGYDIDSPRGGGRVALARLTGMSPSSVGRMLAGQTLPDPVHLETLANALSLPLGELLVRSGLISRGAIPDQPQPAPRPLAPAEAARRLGITDPLRVALFEALVATLTNHPNHRA